MIIDLAGYDGPEAMVADLCIAGAGAAGLTIARAFVGTRAKVVVLEGGGREIEEASQALYRGTNLGHPYGRLDRKRLRYLGGTTNHWGGTCRPLTASDFERRPWVPHSGWPIGEADLLPFRKEAHEILDLGAPDYDPERLRPPAGDLAALDPAKLTHHLYRMSAPTRFGLKFGPILEQAWNVDLYLHANLVDIRQTEGGGRTRTFEVATGDGKRLTVRARTFVLALGGIENPRLLLNADRQARAGLGNGHDLVGRFFMEHLHGLGARLIRTDPDPLRDPYRTFERDGHHLRVAIGLAEAVRRRAEVLDLSIIIRRAEPYGLSAGYEALLDLWEDSRRGRFGRLDDHLLAALRDLEGISTDLYKRMSGNMDFAIEAFVQAEQAPNPDSRVVLMGERDRLGLRRVGLDWRLLPVDLRTIEVAMALLAEEVGRLGLGRAKLARWVTRLPGDLERTPLKGGGHHMGTTRMADDPKAGVVDRDCRVHGIDNLYVAGSSVFATSGYANPTLTIVELALRLADHLRTRV